MPFRTFQIAEATISLYPVDSSGQPDTDTPVWLRYCAESVRVNQTLDEVLTAPTGSTWKRAHHVGEEHEIEIDTLWTPEVALVEQPASLAVSVANTPPGQAPSVTNATDYKLRRNQQYVMVIVWEGEREAKEWAFRSYFGVTDRSGSLGADTPDDGMRTNLRFRAQYYLT